MPKYQGYYIDYDSFQNLCKSLNETPSNIPICPANHTLSQRFMQNEVKENIILATEFPFSSIVFTRRGDIAADGMWDLYLNQSKHWASLQTFSDKDAQDTQDQLLGRLQMQSLNSQLCASWTENISSDDFLPAIPTDESDTSIETTPAFRNYESNIKNEEMLRFTFSKRHRLK